MEPCAPDRCLRLRGTARILRGFRSCGSLPLRHTGGKRARPGAAAGRRNRLGRSSVYLHASRGPGNAKKDLIFASLLEADEKGIVGWMAESWKVDGNDYTFTLHPDAKFHDGEPLTAEDVAFTIDYYRQFPPVNNPLGAGESFLISGYEVLDPQRIKISVNRSDAVTLTALGGFEILPKHIWERVEDPMTYSEPDAFIGSGAYCFSSYDGAAGSYEFTAFDGFCAGEPAADRIQFVPVSDELLAFENGEIDIAGCLPIFLNVTPPIRRLE